MLNTAWRFPALKNSAIINKYIRMTVYGGHIFNIYYRLTRGRIGTLRKNKIRFKGFSVKKANWEKIIFWFVLATLIASSLFSLVNIIISPTEPVEADEFQKLRSDYILMFLQCMMGIVVMFLPSILERRLKIHVPGFMHIVFIIFLYAAIYLGEVQSFYYLIPNWDTILHTFSGAMVGALGFSIVKLLNDSDKVQINLSPLFVAIFAFSFALAIGVLWEVYEFSFDKLLGLNMQKFALENGTQLVGREALSDTMMDLIVDAVGALATSIMGFISLKFKKGWLEKFEVTRYKTCEEKSAAATSAIESDHF